MGKPKKKEKKEHGIVYPSSLVHISTLPLKLIAKKKKAEADSASSQVAVLRVDKKQEANQGPVKTPLSVQFRESNNHQFKSHSFEVILLKEGMGNFKDRFFYTKEALKTAAESKIFDGAQCFADHPTEIEEQIQPERSTRDILGYYENVNYQESDDGTGILIASLSVANSISLDWAMSLLTNSIDYSAKFRETDLVGLSINASGSANPVKIEEFIRSQKLSPSVLAKLTEAQTQGITEINVVEMLKDAQSVDLVTKAGAGGKILKMLEMEKQMKKKNRFFESEGAEKHHEDGAADASAMAPKSKGTPEHKDEGQDKALFAKMIKQYLGKDDADQEEMEMAKNSLDAHHEAGMEGNEAYEAAGKHLQMAMAIGKKMAQCKKETESEHESESESESESEKHESESESESESEAHHEGEMPMKKESKKKESMTVIQLSGEVAKLRESIKRYEMRDYLDSKCKNSGESNSVTKKFREALGSPKSKQHIDDTWTLFMKAFKAGAADGESESEGLFVEKSNYRESDVKQKKSSFADCKR